MRCTECNSELLKTSGDYLTEAPGLGDVRVPGINWLQCSCGERYLSAGEATKIDIFLKEKTDELIGSRPFRDFLSAAEATDILGVTKQAFNKNQRIKRGFIHALEKDGRRFYLKDSVLAYKESGDGRIPLAAVMPVNTDQLDAIVSLWFSEVAVIKHACVPSTDQVGAPASLRKTYIHRSYKHHAGINDLAESGDDAFVSASEREQHLWVLTGSGAHFGKTPTRVLSKSEPAEKDQCSVPQELLWGAQQGAAR